MNYPKRAVRLFLGLLSFLPLAVLVAILGSALASAAGGTGIGLLADDSDTGFFLLLSLCMGLGLFSVALLAYFVLFIFRSDRVRAEHKALWAIVLFMGNAIGFPLFWFVYFWRDAENLAEGAH